MSREPQDDEVEQFFHEHELPRKRRKSYDDITESDRGGDENEL